MVAIKSAQTPDNDVVVDVLVPNRDRRWTPFMLGSTIIAIEIVVLLLTAMGAAWVRLDSPFALQHVVPIILVAIPTLLTLNRFLGLYSIGMMTRRVVPLLRWFASWSATMAVIFAVLFFTQSGSEFSRLWVGIWYLLVPLCVLPLRGVWSSFLRRLASNGSIGEYVVLAVAGAFSEENTATLRESVRHAVFMRDQRNHGDNDLPSTVTKVLRNADRVVLAFDPQDTSQLTDWVSECRALNVHVDLVPSISLTMRVYESHRLDTVTAWRLATKPLSDGALLSKRLEDVILTSILLLSGLPLMALIAAAVRFDTPGPVLFRQARHGFNNEPFQVLKFRSMTHEAEPTSSEVTQASRHDPRVTRVGKFIRKTSLDELPKLFNVLRGDMSLVGPRPHAMAHNDEFGRQIEDYVRRHRLKPGITGWAQVNGFRGETETLDKMESRVAHDLYYIDNLSLTFDLQILPRTALVLAHPNTY
jgi:Undecaprenyl-phosphate glucose phosphotransferase